MGIDSITKFAAAPSRGLRPQVGWLTVNRECNMRCEWCYAKGTGYAPQDSMTLEFALELSNAMISNGVTNITLIGGEPTLWPHLLEYLELFKGSSTRITLVTNGTRFGSDNFWNLYQIHPASSISISIKAFDEESYRCTTGRSNFSITKKGIQRALSLPKTHSSIVFTGEDPDQIIEFARFVRVCGSNRLGISPATPAYVNGSPDSGFLIHPQRFVDGIAAHYEELNGMFDGNISISAKLPLCMWPKTLVRTMVERKQLFTTCQLQHRSGLIFDVTGKLLSCNSLPDHPIGKWGDEFATTSSLKEHINSAPVVSFYDKLTTYAASPCKNCSVRSLCGGGCPLFYGVYQGKDLVRGWDETNDEGVDLLSAV
jgi:radical SAM protein with 4Fe4S-binding SPASM domain